MTTTQFYDSTNPDLIPDGVDVCLYGSGPFAAKGYPRLSRFASVLWIDVTAGDPAGCSILDVETLDATPADVPEWVRRRLALRGGPARIYCGLSNWAEVRRQATEHLSAFERSHIRYWIANPTGEEHLVPGSAACQYAWQGDFDISACRDRWY